MGPERSIPRGKAERAWSWSCGSWKYGSIHPSPQYAFMVECLVKHRDKLLYHSIKTSSGNQPASYPIGTGGNLCGDKVTGVWSWSPTTRSSPHVFTSQGQLYLYQQRSATEYSSTKHPSLFPPFLNILLQTANKLGLSNKKKLCLGLQCGFFSWIFEWNFSLHVTSITLTLHFSDISYFSWST
jgi:hypothetical protein